MTKKLANVVFVEDFAEMDDDSKEIWGDDFAQLFDTWLQCGEKDVALVGDCYVMYFEGSQVRIVGQFFEPFAVADIVTI